RAVQVPVGQDALEFLQSKLPRLLGVLLLRHESAELVDGDALGRKQHARFSGFGGFFERALGGFLLDFERRRDLCRRHAAAMTARDLKYALSNGTRGHREPALGLGSAFCTPSPLRKTPARDAGTADGARERDHQNHDAAPDAELAF